MRFNSESAHTAGRNGIIRTISFLLVSLTLIFAAASSGVIAAADTFDAEAYRAELAAKGFPESYLDDLVKLRKKHPTWDFNVLDITDLSKGKYTWDYVIQQETDENDKRSLVSNSDSYLTLRDFSNFNLYDSGWWKASKYAVEYMMDPRNFLDEKQIFQFYDLGWSDSVTVEAVEAALKGTFMANAKLDGEYSDTTYAQFLYDTGKELGANPVYLASKIRNEQGVSGNSSLINGACGDKLWYYYSNKITGSEGGKLIKAPTSGYSEASLKAYNGYYNYFNIGAAGTGYFAIYLGGMNEAKTGTAHMASKWGGSPSWNTRWKSIYGGAYKATNTYIKDYQNTPYLQKFNVDARSSRNFWGQYMQSIHGSIGIATPFYTSFSTNKMLDLPSTFLIPVYDGMPEECPYPDGTELSSTKYIDAANVVSYEFVDLKKCDGEGLMSKYASAKISWRVFVGKSKAYLELGTVDLSKYDSVLIEYSVSEKFDVDACGTTSFIGLVSDSNHLYGGEGSEPDLTSDLCNRKMTNGDNGYLSRRVVSLDVSSQNYCGDVFLNAYTQSGQRYIVHNIVFVTKTGHTGSPETKPSETAVPETSAPITTAPITEGNTVTTGAPVTDKEQTGTGVNRNRDIIIVIIIIMAAAIAGGATYIIIVKKRDNDNTTADKANAGGDNTTEDKANIEGDNTSEDKASIEGDNTSGDKANTEGDNTAEDKADSKDNNI